MIIDKLNRDFAALMLAEILFKKDLINKETYLAVKRNCRRLRTFHNLRKIHYTTDKEVKL